MALDVLGERGGPDAGGRRVRQRLRPIPVAVERCQVRRGGDHEHVPAEPVREFMHRLLGGAGDRPLGDQGDDHHPHDGRRQANSHQRLRMPLMNRSHTRRLPVLGPRVAANLRTPGPARRVPEVGRQSPRGIEGLEERYRPRHHGVDRPVHNAKRFAPPAAAAGTRAEGRCPGHRRSDAASVPRIAQTDHIVMTFFTGRVARSSTRQTWCFASGRRLHRSSVITAITIRCLPLVSRHCFVRNGVCKRARTARHAGAL